MTQFTKINIKTIVYLLFGVASIILFGVTQAMPVVFALNRSYKTTDSTIKPGMVVALLTQDENQNTRQATKQNTGQATSQNTGQATKQPKNSLIQKASQAKAELTLGVVVPAGEGELTYTAGEDGELLVASSGRVAAYVSDLNGVPHTGDLLVPSPLAGILMRASNGAKGVVGVLSQKFPETDTGTNTGTGTDARTNTGTNTNNNTNNNTNTTTKTVTGTDTGTGTDTNTETQTLKDGKKVRLATVMVDLDVRPLAKITTGSNPLQRFIESITNRKVTAAQAIVSLVVMLITIVVVGSIIYASAAYYLVAMGRNPLAHRQLSRGLVQMFGLVIGVLVFGLLGSLAVLWL